jgi:hypothetical protein
MKDRLTAGIAVWFGYPLALLLALFGRLLTASRGRGGKGRTADDGGLVMRLGATSAVLLLAVTASDVLVAQSDSGPRFEVVSIKRNTSGELRYGPPIQRPDGGFTRERSADATHQPGVPAYRG